MKSTDIPNGFVVMGQAGLPVLIDFDDDGNPVESGLEMKSDGWLDKKHLGPDLIALVHTVKGEENMLVKAVCVMRLSNKGMPITAVQLGKAKQLMETAKNLRDKYIEGITLREKDPTAPIAKEFLVLKASSAK
jgi:hypothetical protein